MKLPWQSENTSASFSRTDDAALLRHPGRSDDLGMIPVWSILLAIAAFAAMQYLFHGVLPHHKHEMLPMRLLMGYSWGTLVASYVLAVGYFLLRQPMLSRCPHCSTEIASSYHFCPQCQFQMAPVCGQCFRGVEITDIFCKQCGHDLQQDESPARLRAYHD